jgi:DNA (cytosine-5)-methyltransferase 1
VNYLSLFAGIGGLDLGLDRAGMTCVGQIELDDYCRTVLAQHWPEVPQHDDVRTAPDWWTSGPRPAVHLVAGGFPCQPFSSAGLRAGVGDPRWGWPWFRAVVRAVRPRYVLLENVAALVVERRFADAFGRVLADLAADGFDADWTVLSACAVGAPHSRERVFLVAHSQGDHGADPGARGQEARGLRAQPRGSRRPTWRDRWLPEPAMDRVAHGVPRRLVGDELHALGNAVVPQVAEHIGRLIVAADEAVAA